MTAPFDYLVVGAGAAGSVMASRLSEQRGASVLLLEAGADVVPGAEPADIRNLFPMSMFNGQYFWSDLRVHMKTAETSPPIPFPQGRIVGGSSAINGMWALRGVPSDYDEWQALGADGWSWADVLPYFRKLEHDHDFSGPMHGGAGPIDIRRLPRSQWPAMDTAIQKAMTEFGWSTIEDMNAQFEDGCGVLPLSISEKARSSSGIAYLSAAVRARPNLTVETGVEARRLVVEEGRAVGVVARRADGSEATFHGARVIVAAGALQTPTLLLRSGIGPGRDLADAGVAVQADLAGVGRNLQNHPLLMIACMLRPKAQEKERWKPAGATFLRWSSHVEGCSPSDMSMWVRSEVTWHALGRKMGAIYPVLGRPLSRGRVSLGKDGAHGSPRVEFNFLTDDRDLNRMKDAVVLASRIFESPAMAPITAGGFILTKPAGLMRYNMVSRANRVRGRLAATLVDLAPPLGHAAVAKLAATRPLSDLVADDQALTDYVRASTVGGGHVCGTCRIGRADDREAVVDNQGRVHGVANLFIADTSIMPSIPSGNTHLPAIMAAEKIADAVLRT